MTSFFSIFRSRCNRLLSKDECFLWKHGIASVFFFFFLFFILFTIHNDSFNTTIIDTVEYFLNFHIFLCRPYKVSSCPHSLFSLFYFFLFIPNPICVHIIRGWRFLGRSIDRSNDWLIMFINYIKSHDQFLTFKDWEELKK